MPDAQPLALPGYAHVYSGKVRDLYAPLGDDGEPRADRLLLVASNRVSAYDFSLAPEIPDKGEVLTRLSLWWFDQLADIVPNHVVSTDVPAEVAGRAVLCERLEMLPVECVARAYLTGGGLAEYAETGAVSGVALPAGLRDGDRLPEPIFTPSTKAPAGEHDEPIAYAEVERLVGPERAASVRDLTVAILRRGNEVAQERGILLADTKVEFGLRGDEVVLARLAAALWARVCRPVAEADLEFARVLLRADDAPRAVLAALDGSRCLAGGPQILRAAPLAASLANHGLTATVRSGLVRVAPHVGTGADTLRLFGDALAAFASARVW